MYLIQDTSVNIWPFRKLYRRYTEYTQNSFAHTCIRFTLQETLTDCGTCCCKISFPNMTAVHTSVEDSVWKKGVKEVIVIFLCQNKGLLWWRGQKIFITWAVHAKYPHSLLTLYFIFMLFSSVFVLLLLFFRATFCTFTLTAPWSPRLSLPLLHISYSVFSPSNHQVSLSGWSRGADLWISEGLTKFV